MNELKSLLFDRTLFDYQPESVANKSILITGGTTGIGRATAILLASQGARVMVFGRHEQELNDALKDIRQSGEETFGMTADAANPEDIQRVFAEVDRQFGRLDILINNAALAYQSIMEGSYQDWQYIVNTNLLGYMAVAHEAIERMKAQGQGHIVNVGSMSADVREKDSSVYVATKAGIQGFSEALRKEVNPLGIKVTLIEPGAVGTDMQESQYPPEEQRKREEELKMLKAEDIAACVLYTLTQPRRCDVVSVQIRPHMQSI
ncbi:MAG TPA: SDR family oxidoreductase [Anaerolineales bacterium]|nr:SDR family oxidoreductase [Anaerolineales bacterium]